MNFNAHTILGKGGVVSSILTGGTTKPIIFKQFSGPGDSPVSTDIYGKKRKRVERMWGRCTAGVPRAASTRAPRIVPGWGMVRFPGEAE